MIHIQGNHTAIFEPCRGPKPVLTGPRLAAYAVCETGLLVEGGNIRLMAIVCVDGLEAVGEVYQN